MAYRNSFIYKKNGGQKSHKTVPLQEWARCSFQLLYPSSLFTHERTLISGAEERYKKKSKRVTSKLPNLHFERFALEQYKEKRAD